MFQYHHVHLIYICACIHLQTKLNTIYAGMALFDSVIREPHHSFRELAFKNNISTKRNNLPKNMQQHFTAVSDALKYHIETIIQQISNYARKILPISHETDKNTEKY